MNSISLDLYMPDIKNFIIKDEYSVFSVIGNYYYVYSEGSLAKGEVKVIADSKEVRYFKNDDSVSYYCTMLLPDDEECYCGEISDGERGNFADVVVDGKKIPVNSIIIIL